MKSARVGKNGLIPIEEFMKSSEAIDQIVARTNMQMVGVGFIIGVIQDSVETALNSSGDVIFCATAEFKEWQKQGKELPF